MLLELADDDGGMRRGTVLYLPRPEIIHHRSGARCIFHVMATVKMK